MEISYHVVFILFVPIFRDASVDSGSCIYAKRTKASKQKIF